MKEVIVNFNFFLKLWVVLQLNNIVGKGQIEIFGQVENQVWQNCKVVFMQYENDFGDVFECVFESGVIELDDVVVGLNCIGFCVLDGIVWIVVCFCVEMVVLVE